MASAVIAGESTSSVRRDVSEWWMPRVLMPAHATWYDELGSAYFFCP